jgi:hypothetical protein
MVWTAYRWIDPGAAFRDLKSDLAIRPIFHQREDRIESHIFVAFLAYCVHVTFKHQLKAHAPGLTARQALEKLSAMQLLDVHFPTTDGRELLFTRYTEPEADQQLLLTQLGSAGICRRRCRRGSRLQKYQHRCRTDLPSSTLGKPRAYARPTPRVAKDRLGTEPASRPNAHAPALSIRYAPRQTNHK